jgi:hypothetical protein
VREILEAEQYPTLSLVVPLLVRLLKDLEGINIKSSTIDKVRKTMITSLKTRWDLKQPTLLIAWMLDPHTEDLRFFSTPVSNS